MKPTSKVILFFVFLALQLNLGFACENACSECQRAVYQLKFQGSADCFQSKCSNICYKITETWNSPANSYEYFKKDVFGKCEICFRNGFCKISQCAEQQKNENEIINQIVNSSRLTAKVSDYLKNSLPNKFVDLNTVKTINKKIGSLTSKSLKSVLIDKSSSKFIHYMQGLYSTYFDSLFDMPENIKEVFNNLKKGEETINPDEINEDAVIKGFSKLSHLEDKISELEEFGNRYKNKKNEFPHELVENINKIVEHMMLDYKKYQKKFKIDIKTLEKNKEKIKKAKINIKEDKELLELNKIQEKITKIEKDLKDLEKRMTMKKEKLKKLLKLFR